MFLFKARICVALMAALITYFIAFSDAYAGDSLAIFDKRKNLVMNDFDPVFYDYYVNGGTERGLKRGMYVSVTRSIPLHDPLQSKAQGNMHVEVARVQIIHAERGLAVARSVAELGTEDRPVLEYEGVMIGDQIDLASASLEAPKLKKKSAQSGSATSATAGHAPAAVARAPDAPSRSEASIPVTPLAPNDEKGAAKPSEAAPKADAPAEKLGEKTSANQTKPDMVSTPNRGIATESGRL